MIGLHVFISNAEREQVDSHLKHTVVKIQLYIFRILIWFTKPSCMSTFSETNTFWNHVPLKSNLLAGVFPWKWNWFSLKHENCLMLSCLFVVALALKQRPPTSAAGASYSKAGGGPLSCSFIFKMLCEDIRTFYVGHFTWFSTLNLQELFLMHGWSDLHMRGQWYTCRSQQLLCRVAEFVCVFSVYVPLEIAAH